MGVAFSKFPNYTNRPPETGAEFDNAQIDDTAVPSTSTTQPTRKRKQTRSKEVEKVGDEAAELAKVANEVQGLSEEEVKVVKSLLFRGQKDQVTLTLRKELGKYPNTLRELGADRVRLATETIKYLRAKAAKLAKIEQQKGYEKALDSKVKELLELVVDEGKLQDIDNRMLSKLLEQLRGRMKELGIDETDHVVACHCYGAILSMIRRGCFAEFSTTFVRPLEPVDALYLIQPFITLLLKNMQHKKFESTKDCQKYKETLVQKTTAPDSASKSRVKLSRPRGKPPKGCYWDEYNGYVKSTPQTTKDVEVIKTYKNFNDNRAASTENPPNQYINLNSVQTGTSCTVVHPFLFTIGGAQYICPGMIMNRGRDEFSKRAVEDILVVSKLLNGSEDSGSVGSVGSGGGGGGLNFFDGADFAPSSDDILKLEIMGKLWEVLEAVGLQEPLEAKAIDGVEKKYAMCVNNFIGVTLTAGRQVYMFFEGGKPIFFQTQLRTFVRMTDDSMSSLNALHASEAAQLHLSLGGGIGEMVEGEVEEKMSFVMKSSGSLYALAIVCALVGDYKLLRMLQRPDLLPIVLRADENGLDEEDEGDEEEEEVEEEEVATKATPNSSSRGRKCRNETPVEEDGGECAACQGSHRAHTCSKGASKPGLNFKNCLLSHIKREIPHLIGKLERGEIELADFLAERVVDNLLHCDNPTPWIICHALGNTFAEGSWDSNANANGKELTKRQKENEGVVEMAEKAWSAYKGKFEYEHIRALWNRTAGNDDIMEMPADVSFGSIADATAGKNSMGGEEFDIRAVNDIAGSQVGEEEEQWEDREDVERFVRSRRG
ncbi:hypothetical protein TrCOL_g3754 [Triparma columacea]|uniref:Uncharacterized protein n=1 Tax=Triparma columacea TaxID=722753 RepID=A0A9W7G506_9STRA|nr:hypothetical protein TrCOL_g3754 [Triparma columacea]